GRGRLALDRQREQRVAGRRDTGAGLSRRLLGPGRGIGVPAGDPVHQRPAQAGRQACRETGEVSDAGQHVLLADIGGTNARFALADTSARIPLREDTVVKYAVADFPSLGDAARHYLDGAAAWAGG